MSDAPRFWLVTGDSPSGPLTIPQIHEQLAAGTITWQTPSCRVGDVDWLPLFRQPGLGPNAVSATSATNSGVSNHTSPLDPTSPAEEVSLDVQSNPTPAIVPHANENPPSQSGNIVGILFGIGLLGAVAYFLYWSLFPLSPKQIVERFEAAKSPAAAKYYATERMYPLIDMPDMYAANDTNRTFITGDAAPIGRSDEHYVGVSSAFHDPETRRIISAQGVYHLVHQKSGGWKVNDLLILSWDDQELPRPVSILELIPGQQGKTPSVTLDQDLSNRAKGWFDTASTKDKAVAARGVAGGLFLLSKSGGIFKAIIGGVIVIGAVLAAWGRRRKAG